MTNASHSTIPIPPGSLHPIISHNPQSHFLVSYHTLPIIIQLARRTKQFYVSRFIPAIFLDLSSSRYLAGTHTTTATSKIAPYLQCLKGFPERMPLTILRATSFACFMFHFFAFVNRLDCRFRNPDSFRRILQAGRLRRLARALARTRAHG